MSSLKIEYSYADGSANTVRRTGVTYPDGRQVTYDYGDSGSDADRLSRVAEVKVDGTAVTAYTYLGLSSVVESDNLVPQTRWNLITGSGADPYTALDRFGRAVDYPWQKYSSPTGTPARLEYGYDRASNRLWRQDDPARAASAGYDELYGYDTADRLTQVQRGTLNGGHTGITGQTLEQNWDLDPTGNWNEFDVDLPGSSNDLNQQRTQNAANEITDIEATTGPVWSTPSYDRAGNTTSFPLPGAEASAMSGVYDAWNRPVQWKLGSDSVARYAYDGLNRRTLSYDDRLSWDEFTLAQWAAFTLAQWQTFELNSQTEARHYYYSDAWQPLEERLGSAGTAQRQFVWGLRYIDDLILRDRDTTDSGSLDERLYALQDANWNVVALIDESAAVQQRVAYTPYGVPTFLDAGFAASTNSFDWETLFTGQRYDNPSGLYLYRMRFYHPQLGRFIIREDFGGFVIYSYVNSNPLRSVDPSGWCVLCDVGFVQSGSVHDYDRDFKGANPFVENAKNWLTNIQTLAINEGLGVRYLYADGDPSKSQFSDLKTLVPDFATYYYSDPTDNKRWLLFSQFALVWTVCEADGVPCKISGYEHFEYFSNGQLTDSGNRTVYENETPPLAGTKLKTGSYGIVRKPKNSCDKKIVLTDIPTIARSTKGHEFDTKRVINRQFLLDGKGNTLAEAVITFDMGRTQQSGAYFNVVWAREQ